MQQRGIGSDARAMYTRFSNDLEKAPSTEVSSSLSWRRATRTDTGDKIVADLYNRRFSYCRTVAERGLDSYLTSLGQRALTAAGSEEGNLDA